MRMGPSQSRSRRAIRPTQTLVLVLVECCGSRIGVLSASACTIEQAGSVLSGRLCGPEGGGIEVLTIAVELNLDLQTNNLLPSIQHRLTRPTLS